MPNTIREQAMRLVTRESLSDNVTVGNNLRFDPTSAHRTISTRYNSWVLRFEAGTQRGNFRIEYQFDIDGNRYFACNLEMPDIQIMDTEHHRMLKMRGYYGFRKTETIMALKRFACNIEQGMYETLGDIRVAYARDILSLEEPHKVVRARNISNRTSRATIRNAYQAYRWDFHSIGYYHSHSGLALNMEWAGNGNEITIGREFEINSENTHARRAVEIWNNSLLGHAYFETDSSITGRGKLTNSRDKDYYFGVEIITMPHTWENYKAICNSGVFENLIAEGFCGSDSGLCGTHTHINRKAYGSTQYEQHQNLMKIIKFMLSHRAEFEKLFGRKNVDFAVWPNSDTDEAIRYYVCENLSAHSKGLNQQHRATYEWRFPAGCLKADRNFAVVDVLRVMAINCHHMEYGDINTENWLAGIEQPTKDYLASRGILGY